jgi:hypothetical protein
VAAPTPDAHSVRESQRTRAHWLSDIIADSQGIREVEPTGIEPVTSCLQIGTYGKLAQRNICI